jgi:hypothetical protein
VAVHWPLYSPLEHFPAALEHGKTLYMAFPDKKATRTVAGFIWNHRTEFL